MAASDDAVRNEARWTLVDEEGNVQGSDSDIGSVSSSDCVAVEEDTVSYHAKRSRSSTGNSVSGSPPRNQIDQSTDNTQNVPTSSSSWLGGFWTKNTSPASANSRLNETEENKPLPSVPQEEKDTHDTESLESIEVLSMPSDGHSDTDIHPNSEDVETLGTFDPLGAVGSDWNRCGDVVQPMCATNVVTPMEGLSPTPCVEDLTSSSNSSQLDFLIVDHQGPKNDAIEEEEAASNENPRGNTVDEEERMERSVGTAEPLPTMPPGQLPLSSVSVDNIPRGVEAGGSPRRAQSEGCITQQSEEVSGVGVPIMTQRWPTEDGGFLLVQQFRGDGEPAMSRSSSFSDLSSSFSYPGVRRRIPTNSTSSLQRQGTEGSETSSSEASHYNSDSSNDALPANMTVSGIKPGIRQYLHQRDESLNSKLTLAALIVVTAAMALVLGHYIGSMQATSHHLGIEAGQVWRLRSLQDQLVTCLDKTKTLLRGAKGSTGTSQPKATSPLDPQSSAELPVPSVYMIQESDSDNPFSCSVCENGEQPMNRYSELCNTQCKPNKDGKDLQEPLSNGSDVSDHVLKLSHIGESFPDIDMTSKCMPDVHTTCPQIQSEPQAQGKDTVIDLQNGDAGNTDPAMDVLPLSEVEPVDNEELDDRLIAEGSVLEQDHAAEAEESEGGAESDKKKQGDTEINQVNAPAYKVDSSSPEKHDAPDEAKLNTEDVTNDSLEQGEDETLYQVEEILDQVEEILDPVEEELLDQEEEQFLDPVEEEFLDPVEEEFLDQVEEEFVDQVEAEFQDQVEVESQARGEEEAQDQDGEEFLDKEVEFSDSSSPSTEGDNVDSQEETTESPDEDFMGKLSAKLSDSWFILRNFTTDLMGSAANLSVNNVTTQLKENVETLRHQIKDAVSNLQKSNITTHLKDNVNSLGEHLKDAVSNIKEGNFSRTVKDTMQDLGGKVRNAVTGIKESNITSQIKESLHGLGEKIQGAVSSVKESGRQLKKPFKNTVKAVKNLIKGKPINSGKETDEEKLEQEDFVQPKEPSANKKKGKSNRKSPGQVAKQRLKRKERAKNKRKEDIKKINSNKNAKQKNDMKTNRKKNNHNKDQSKNQQTVMKEKSHSLDTHVKTERHGKSESHKKNEKKHQPNQVNKHNRKDGEEKRMKRKDKEILHDNKDSKKHRSEKLNGNDQDSKHIQEHLSYRSVPSRKIHGDNMDTERKSEVERKSDMKFQPDDAKIREEPPTSKERKYHKDDHSQKGKQLYEQRHKDKRKHESEESSYHHNHQSKHTHHQESNNHRGHRHNGKKHANHHHDKAHDTRHRFGDKMWEESTHHRHYQGKHNHHQEKNDYFGHGHEDKKHGKENQDKEGDTKFRFEDIKWEDIFDSFDVRCFGVRDCLRKQREAAVKLYEELLDYQDWLTKRCYKKHLDELKDFMEELEEFLAEPFLTDADLEELMEDFEDMAEDIEKATTKNFWKFMKMKTPRQKGGEDSESRDHSKRGSNKKKQREDKEKTLTVTLDLKQALNSSETVDVSESDDYRRHAGYGYQSNDDWFIRRMQDREKSRNKEDQYETLEEHPNEANGNWYDHWMQGREDGRTGMTVWDLYQWFSKRQALRHEWRLHEMDDQSNWFLRRP